MSKFTQTLRMEEEAVSRKAKAHRAFAQRQLELGNQIAMEYAATYFLSSALYTSLLSPADSIKLFEGAADAYQNVHHPFKIICDLIATKHRHADKSTRDIGRYTGTEEARLYLLISDFAAAFPPRVNPIRTDSPFSIFHRLRDEHFVNRNIQGSSFSFIDVTNALAEVSNNMLNREDDFTYTRSLIAEFVKELQGATKDPSWRQLRPNSIPYNPISLALTLVLSDTIGDNIESKLFKSTSFNEPSIASFYWDLAKAINAKR